MTTEIKKTHFLVYLGVIILQMIMTQVVTFVVTLFIPADENISMTNPALLTAILGLTFGVGVFWAGWLAIRLGWLRLPAKHLARLAGALLGAYLPLVGVLIIYRSFEPGNPVFWFSIIGSVLGFYVLGWEDGKQVEPHV